MVLDHPLSVLIGERFFAELNHLHIVEAGLRRWYECGTTFEHRLIYSFLHTVLQYYVVDLLLQAVFKIFDLQGKLLSEILLEQLELLVDLKV